MKLTEIEKIVEVSEMKDTKIILASTNEPVEKESIGHFVIFYSEKFFGLEDEESKKKRGGRRKKVVVEESEEEDVRPNLNIEEYEGSEEQVVTIIANRLKITESSMVRLQSDKWYICPIFKELDRLSPIKVVKESKCYSLYIMDTKPIIDFDGYNIMKGCRPNDFRYNALDVIYSAINEFGINFIYPKAVFRMKKNNQSLLELRSVVSQYELLQKTRIKVGNNIVSLIFSTMGRSKFIESKESRLKEKFEDNFDEKKSLENLDNDKVLDVVVQEYNEITLYAENHNITIKNNKSFEQFKTPYLSSYMMYCLASEFIAMLNIETKMKKIMEDLVKEQPIWQNYLVGIKGVGANIAAYLISYLDIYKANHPSAFLKYCGLDQVAVIPDEKEIKDTNPKKLANFIRLMFRDLDLIQIREKTEGMMIDESNFNFFKTDTINSYAEYLFVKVLYDQFGKAMNDYEYGDDITELIADIMAMVKKNKVAKELFDRLLNSYELMLIHDGEYGDNVPVIKKRARRMSDREIVPYLTSGGDIKLKKCLGYNNTLKAKLLGVLSGSFLKAKGSGYSQMYYDYRLRLDARDDAKGIEHNKAHNNRCAIRYVIQIFLEDYWMAFRTLEGLPLNGGTYREEKLKLYHRNRNGEIRVRPGLQNKPIKNKTSKDVKVY